MPPAIRSLPEDPKFQALSPEAKNIVIDRLASEDQEFGSLSEEAKAIVRSRIVGAASASPQPVGDRGPSIQKPVEPAPLGPVLIDQFKKGFASVPSIAALTPGGITGGIAGAITRGITGNQSIKQTAAEAALSPLRTAQSIAQPIEEQLGVKNLPVPPNEYGRPSKSNEYLAKLANFAGASVLPGIGVIGAAERKLIAALVEIASTSVSATSAVEGKELGKNLSKTYGVDENTGAAIGELLGSLAGPGLVAGVGQGVQKATQKTTEFVSETTGLTGFSKEAQERAGKLLATKELRESLGASPQSQQNLVEAVKLQEQIPGFQPTLGQSSGAPGVIAIEKRIASSSPEHLARAAERERTNISAIAKFENETFPAAQQTPLRPVRRFYDELTRRSQEKLDDINAQIRRLSESPGIADNAEIGARLRVLRNEAQNTARATKNSLYDRVYESARSAGIKEDVSDVRNLIKEIAGSDENAAQIMPELLADIKQAITKYKPAKAPEILGPTGQPMRATPTTIEVPFEALHSMYKRAGADLLRAQMSQDPTKAYYIGQVRALLKQKVFKYEGEQYGQIAQDLKTANEFFSKKYAPVFYEGAGGRMASFNKFGDRTPDEDIVQKLIFKPGGQKGIEDFVQIYGNSPEAYKLLETGVMDMFARAVVRDGEIKPALVESFFRTHPQLSSMPKLSAQLRAMDSANDALLARRATIQEEQKLLDRTVLAKIAKSDDVESVVNKALTDRKTMAVLASQAIKTPEGRKALARGIADAVAKKDDPYEFLLQNVHTLKPHLDALGPKHYSNLAILAGAQRAMQRVQVPTAVELTKLQDVGEQAVGTSVKGIFSRMLNVKKGYMSGQYMVMDMGGRFIYKIKTAEAQKLLNEAIYDPELAKVLVNMKAQPVPERINNLKHHAFSHGIRVASVESQEQQE